MLAALRAEYNEEAPPPEAANAFAAGRRYTDQSWIFKSCSDATATTDATASAANKT